MSKAKAYAKQLMSMKEWESSKMDAKLDKSGKHGKEGSPKDERMDKAALAAYNRGKK